MPSASKGNAAEAAILAAFVKRGYLVLVPFGDGQPYDLAVDLGGPILRIQCRAADYEIDGWTPERLAALVPATSSAAA